jgi:hypothetical protein
MGGEGIQFQSVLTSAIDGGQLSASRPDCFNPGERTLRYALKRRVGGPLGGGGVPDVLTICGFISLCVILWGAVVTELALKMH